MPGGLPIGAGGSRGYGSDMIHAEPTALIWRRL